MVDLDRNTPPNELNAPLRFLKEWAAVNPQPAALIFGSIAVFAAVAVVLDFGLSFEGLVPPILYILGVGVALAVATSIVNNKLIVAGLSWFAIGVGALWFVAFVAHKAVPHGTPLAQQLYCVVWFLGDCKTNIDKATYAAAPPLSPAAPAPPLASTINPDKYSVVVQFAGVLTRDSVRAIMQRLKDQGWNVQGVAGGGDRTSAAAGTSEVRARESDRAAALALAASVQSFGLTAKPVQFVPNNSPDFQSGRLEVWISR